MKILSNIILNAPPQKYGGIRIETVEIRLYVNIAYSIALGGNERLCG